MPKTDLITQLCVVTFEELSLTGVAGPWLPPGPSPDLKASVLQNCPPEASVSCPVLNPEAWT